MRFDNCAVTTAQAHELVERDAEAADSVVVDAALASTRIRYNVQAKACVQRPT